MSIWGKQLISDDSVKEWRIGELDLAVKQVENELWIAAEHCANGTKKNVGATDWSRWAVNGSLQSVFLAPRFPDKAIVVKPENPFRLQPGVQARIFVRVPIFVGLTLRKQTNKPLINTPSVILSNTWFGGPTEGELCYWISSSARRKVTADSTRDFLVICPVQLRNKSPEDLLVEKICLRVKWLSIFQKEDQLWANETRVDYRGGNDVSQIAISAGAPDEAKKAKLLSSPEENSKKNFSIRTFFGLGAEDSVRGVEHN